MAIDRVFSVKGRGVVVTGSLRGGRLERGAVLRLEPGGRSARAREVQVHGGPVEAVEDGGRVALNLAGIDDETLARGAVLTTDPAVRASDRLLAILRRPASLDDRARARAWPLPSGATFRLHLGTESVDATIRRGRRDSADLPDGRRVVTLRLARPIAVAAGDPFVLRVPSPAATAAGGQVLDPSPPVGASARRTSADDLAAFALARLSGDRRRGAGRAGPDPWPGRATRGCPGRRRRSRAGSVAAGRGDRDRPRDRGAGPGRGPPHCRPTGRGCAPRRGPPDAGALAPSACIGG